MHQIDGLGRAATLPMRVLICLGENPQHQPENFLYAGRGKPAMAKRMRLKIAPVLTANLLRLADAYLAAVKPALNKSVSMQSISRSFHGDPPFFDALRSGKSTCGLTKYDDIVDKFEQRWPKGLMHLFPKLIDPRHGPRRQPPKPKRKATNGKNSKKGGGEKRSAASVAHQKA